MHLVLKSRRFLYPHRALIRALLQKYASQFHHRLYGIAVAKDHVHFTLLISDRVSYRKFIRALTAQLAKKLGTKLWSLLPFSRVVSWGRDFQNLMKYFALNRAEAAGLIPHQPRGRIDRRRTP